MISKFGYNKDGFKLQDRYQFHGFTIEIEKKKGSRRDWVDEATGESGSTFMHYDYGYIQGTLGSDQDEVDVYIGDDVNAKNAYIIQQMKKPDFIEVDEQKVMLGFSNANQAKAAYIKQYNDPRFFGGLLTVTLDELQSKLNSYRGSIMKGILFPSLNSIHTSATITDTGVYQKGLIMSKGLTPAQQYALSKDPNAVPLVQISRDKQYVTPSAGLGTSRVALPGEPPVVPVRRVEAPLADRPASISAPRLNYDVNKPFDQSAKEYYKR